MKRDINRTKMAEQPENLDSETWSSEEGELEKLEADVKQMAHKIVELRETLPGQLYNTMAAILDAQRPVILTNFDRRSDPGPSDEPVSDATTSLESGGTVVAERDQENAEKIAVIKQKISSNAATIPLLLKRLKDTMSRIDKLNSSKETIHPAFKRKRTN